MLARAASSQAERGHEYGGKALSPISDRPRGHILQSQRSTVARGNDIGSLKANHLPERHAQSQAKRLKRSEGLPSALCEQIAKRSLVDVRVPRQIPTRPASQDPRSIDCHHVDGPIQGPVRIHITRWLMARTRRSQLGRAALEGTVLRVPCIPSGRRCRPNSEAARCWRHGFWRSSVRGLGPPASDPTAIGSHRRPCGVNHGAPLTSTASAPFRPVSARVTRMDARTRCRLPGAQPVPGLCAAASPHVGVAGDALPPIPMSDPLRSFIPADDTKNGRDVSTTSWDVLGRLETS